MTAAGAGADLHAHSHCSDGLHAPAEVVARAGSAGLSALALTDHDAVDGLEQARAAAAVHRLRLIPGIEISCRHGEKGGVHLLAWFFDPEHSPLRDRLDTLVEARRRRFEKMLEALTRAGAPLSAEAVTSRVAGRVLGRPHVAAALVTAGFARTVQDAFDRWLKVGRPGFVPLERIEAREAIAVVRDAGGVTAVAHPVLGVDDATITQLASAGLAGLEVDHPEQSPERRRHYRRLARRLRLVATAGSDFHGESLGDPPVGTERISDADLAALEARRR